MEIGIEEPAITVEPIQDPYRKNVPEAEPDKVRDPTPQPECPASRKWQGFGLVWLECLTSVAVGEVDVEGASAGE